MVFKWSYHNCLKPTYENHSGRPGLPEALRRVGASCLACQSMVTLSGSDWWLEAVWKILIILISYLKPPVVFENVRKMLLPGGFVVKRREFWQGYHKIEVRPGSDKRTTFFVGIPRWMWSHGCFTMKMLSIHIRGWKRLWLLTTLRHSRKRSGESFCNQYQGLDIYSLISWSPKPEIEEETNLWITTCPSPFPFMLWYAIRYGRETRHDHYVDRYNFWDLVFSTKLLFGNQKHFCKQDSASFQSRCWIVYGLFWYNISTLVVGVLSLLMLSLLSASSCWHKKRHAPLEQSMDDDRQKPMFWAFESAGNRKREMAQLGFPK